MGKRVFGVHGEISGLEIHLFYERSEPLTLHPY